ncbi:MAG: hypothetical protein IJA35_03330 [Clostridia bacterium]|nr:hypothetical protein [Clostridia bacterium]
MDKAAVIDIGSNTLRYAEGRLCLNGLKLTTKKLIRMTRLASGQQESGMLSNKPMQDSMQALLEFKDMAKEKDLPIFCYATSAVREAKNREQFLSEVFQKTGINIDVLSGDEEARLAYLGATGGRGGLIDIGGGSTQIVNDKGSISVPIGCVRGREIMLDQGDFDHQRALLEAELSKKLLPFTLPISDEYTGVGGTITTLCALHIGLTEYDGALVHGTKLTLKRIEEFIRLLSENCEYRINHPLLKQRHDVILPGAIIIAYELRLLNKDHITVSDADGMEGYLLHKLAAL